MNVLLIEDDPVIANSITMVLASERHVCHTAASGVEGIMFADGPELDAIILDLMLPDLDGYQVLRQLKNTQADVPVLILSGLSGVDQRELAFKSGADDFLTKPFNRQELVARVKAMAARAGGYDASGEEGAPGAG